MGVRTLVFRLHRFEGDGCCHDLLVRAVRPSSSNADQAMADAAEAFADSTLTHLRTWWERHRLPADCRNDHRSSLFGELQGGPVGDTLYEHGLRTLDVWVASTDYGSPWIALGAAGTEAEFWTEIEDSDQAGLRPRAPAEQHRVYFLTERDGEGDLAQS